jgi:hypothetical protein
LLITSKSLAEIGLRGKPIRRASARPAPGSVATPSTIVSPQATVSRIQSRRAASSPRNRVRIVARARRNRAPGLMRQVGGVEGRAAGTMILQPVEGNRLTVTPSCQSSSSPSSDSRCGRRPAPRGCQQVAGPLLRVGDERPPDRCRAARYRGSRAGSRRASGARAHCAPARSRMSSSSVGVLVVRVMSWAKAHVDPGGGHHSCRLP